MIRSGSATGRAARTRLVAVTVIGAGLLSGCFGDSGDVPDANVGRSTAPPRPAGSCKDADPAPPVSPDINAAECRWWTRAEDIVGFDNLVIITEEERPGRFTMSAVRAETGERQWTTPPIEAVADRAAGGARTLRVVYWRAQPYAAFQYRTGDRSAVTFVSLSYEGDRTPVTWIAPDKDSQLPHDRAAIDGVAAAVSGNVLPPVWQVVDPTSATTSRLPTSASQALDAIGDGWYAEENVDGFTFTVKRYDGSLAWDPRDFVPDGANPTGTRAAIAAYGDYLLVRWIKAADEGAGAGQSLLAVHDRTGKPLAATEFGTFGHETRADPVDRLVASANQRWLVVHSGQDTAAIDITGGKAKTLEAGLRPLSVTDDGVVYAVNLDGVAVRIDGATGRSTWTGPAGALLPAATVDGVAVVSSTRPATILADRHGTATAWAFGSIHAVTARRLAPMVYLADGEESGPTDASLFIAHSQLMWAHDNGCLEELVVKTVDESALAHGMYRHRTTVDRASNPTDVIPCTEQEHTGPEYRSNQNTHPNRSQEVPGREGFYLDLDNEYREGIGPGAPTYWEFHPGENGKGAYVFWLFYAYNDYTNKHEGDWERIAVQVDGDTPTGVVFWKHEEPACRLPWDRLEHTEDGHPIVYAARKAHGSYARVGHYTHPGGVDETSKGQQWRTWDDGTVKYVKAQRWYGYGGGWGVVAPIEFLSGPDGPNPLYDKAAAALTDKRCDDFAGHWASTDRVSPPLPGDSGVELSIGEGGVGEVTYPQAACTGRLRTTESTVDKVVLAQTITNDPSLRCPKEGTVTLTMTGEELDYIYQAKDGQTRHTARLRRR